MPEIRRAIVTDLPFIVESQLAMALETEDLTLDPARVEAGVRHVFEHAAKGFYLVATVHGDEAGCMLVLPEWSDWRNGEVWWLHSVYVRPEARGAGVFRAMHADVESRARAFGALGLRLYVHRENRRAKDVYRALGMDDQHYELFERLF
jgi:GNAT superfamily N-acetyltransferase